MGGRQGEKIGLLENTLFGFFHGICLFMSLFVLGKNMLCEILCKISWSRIIIE